MKRALQEYVSTAKILSCNLVFRGKITEDIQIDAIRIASINYKATFDSFRITPVTVPENNDILLNRDYIASSFGGMLIGPSMSQTGYGFVEGTAKKSIREISVEAVNGSCVVVNKNNLSQFANYEDDFSTATKNGQRTGPFIKEDPIYLEYDYVFQGIEPDEFKYYDSAIACLRYIFTLDDGTELNSYVYQTSIRAPEYGLVHLLLNES